MNSGRNSNKTNKSIIINPSPRYALPQIEIQRHFDIDKINSNISNPGVATFPYVINDDEFEFENFGMSNLSIQSSSRKSTTPKLDTEFDLLINNTNYDDCSNLNKKVDDINKQLADLEKDIQLNFYDSNLFNLKKPSTTTVADSLSKVKPFVPIKNRNINTKNNEQITQSVRTGSSVKTNLSARKDDPSVGLKHEIMQYRKSIKEKVMEDRMEKKLEELNQVNKCTAQVKCDMRKWISTMPSPHYPPQMVPDLQTAPDIQAVPDKTSGRFEYNNDKKFGNETTEAVKNTGSTQTAHPNPVPKLDLDFNKDSPRCRSISKDEAMDTSAVLVSLTDLASVGKAVHKSKGVLKQIKSDFQEYFDLVETIPVIIKHHSPTRESKDSQNSTSRIKTNRTYWSKSTTSTNRSIVSNPLKSSRSTIKSTFSPIREESSIYKNIKAKYLEPRKSFTEEPPLLYEKKMKSNRTSEKQQASKICNRNICVKSHPINIEDSHQLRTSYKTIKHNQLSIAKKNELTLNLNDTFPINSRLKSPSPDFINKCKQLEDKLNSPEFSDSNKCKLIDQPRQKIPDFINKSTQIDSQLLTKQILSPDHKPKTIPGKEVGNQNKLSVQKLPKIDIRRPLITQRIPDLVIKPEAAKRTVILNENIKYLEISHDDYINQSSLQASPQKIASPIKSEVNKDNDALINEKPPEDEVSGIEKINKAVQLDHVSEVIEIRTDYDHLEDKEHKVVENKLTISQELNINIENLPSIRTLNEIQNYLENRCTLIKKRLAEEPIKPNEALSLRWKLKEAPRWSPSSSENQTSGECSFNSQTSSNKFDTKQKSENQYSGNSSLNTSYNKVDLKLNKITDISKLGKAGPSGYMKQSIDHNKIFLEKIDKIIAEKKETAYTNKDNLNQTIQEIPFLFDKSTQYTITTESTSKITEPAQLGNESKTVEQPITKDINSTPINCSSCKQLLNKTDKLIPRCKLSRHTKTIDIIKPAPSCLNCESKVGKLPIILETELSENSKNNSEEKNDISISKVEKKLKGKHVHFDFFTTNFSIPPEEKLITCTPKPSNQKIEVHDEEETKQVINAHEPPMKTDNKYTLTEEQSSVEPKKDHNICLDLEFKTELLDIIKTIGISNVKILKENSSQYSPPETELNSSIQTKILKKPESENTIHECSPTESDSYSSNKSNKRRNGTTQYSPKENKPQESKTAETGTQCLVEPEIDFASTCNLQNLELYENQLTNNKQTRKDCYKYKKCSTPLESETTSELDSDGILSSDGELKLSCQCSTSIGEIHLCRYANDIRRKVKLLKQNPAKMLQHSLNDPSVGLHRRYRHNDNWISYYISRSSSDEYNTSSYISSIPSNSEVDK